MTTAQSAPSRLSAHQRGTAPVPTAVSDVDVYYPRQVDGNFQQTPNAAIRAEARRQQAQDTLNARSNAEIARRAREIKEAQPELSWAVIADQLGVETGLIKRLRRRYPLSL